MGGEVPLNVREVFVDAVLHQHVLAELLRRRGHTNLSGEEAAIWEPFVARLVAHPVLPTEVFVLLSQYPVNEIEENASITSFIPVGKLGPEATAVWWDRTNDGMFDFPVEVGMPAKSIYHDGNYYIEIRSPRYSRGGATSTRR